MQNETLDLGAVVNRSRQGLTWTNEQRKAVADQFLKDSRGQQPVDRLIKQAMKQVLPKQLWRDYFSGQDPVKKMIHASQGTKPRKDRNKSEAARRAAITRRLGKSPKGQQQRSSITFEEIKHYFTGRTCKICGKEMKSDNPLAKTAHYFRAHTPAGQAVARRAGLNFRSGRNGRKRYKPWQRKKELGLMGRPRPQLGRPRKDQVSIRPEAQLVATERVANEEQKPAIATRVAPAKHPLLIRVVLDLSLAAAAQIVPPNE